MQLFLKLFEPYLQWIYHCFDRIVINGHLLGLMRESQIVYFFRNVCGHPKLTKELLRQRSQEYQTWVEHFALNHKVPLVWAEKHVRKEDLVASRQQRRLQEGRFGVYFIIKSREQGWTFRILPPKFATTDPNYQIVRKQRSLYTHYYFYIVDATAGPMVLRVGSFLPFSVTAYLNGHNFIERQSNSSKTITGSCPSPSRPNSKLPLTAWRAKPFSSGSIIGPSFWLRSFRPRSAPPVVACGASMSWSRSSTAAISSSNAPGRSARFSSAPASSGFIC